MRRVIVESPFAGQGATEEERYASAKINVRYLCRCLRDCLDRGEAPFASHGLYARTGVLNDAVPDERALGIAAGDAWRPMADATVVYMDLGISPGMRHGITWAEQNGREVEYRVLTNPTWKP